MTQSHINFRSLAPVVLFTYNRPIHTKKVLDSLAEAYKANETEVYIFSDGPKDEINTQEITKIKEVRKILREENRFFKVNLVERDVNFGLARSIIEGVTSVIAKHGKIIVLEDDLVVQRDFLSYMNYYLEIYQNEDIIFHISGFQKEAWTQYFLAPAYSTRFMNCSGWATWKDRWEKLVLNLDEIETYLADYRNKKIFDYTILRISEQLSLNQNEIKTWAIFWYSTIFIKSGLCINPKFSYVSNIGDDGSGTNMGKSNTNKVINKAYSFKPYKPLLKESRMANIHVKESYGNPSKIRLKKIKKIVFTMLSILRTIYLKLRSQSI